MDNTPDPEVLGWAAREGRLLLTHDVNTMVGDAWARVRQGLPMPGLVVINRALRVGYIVDRLEVLAVASHEGEWEGQVIFITSE